MGQTCAGSLTFSALCASSGLMYTCVTSDLSGSRYPSDHTAGLTSVMRRRGRKEARVGRASNYSSPKKAFLIQGCPTF